MKSNGYYQREDALSIFSDIKSVYSAKIEELSKLKSDLAAKGDHLDPSQKSKVKILLESLLIDLNEEIFKISEVLANSCSQEGKASLDEKAMQFNQSRKELIKRINWNLDNCNELRGLRRRPSGLDELRSKLGEITPYDNNNARPLKSSRNVSGKKKTPLRR